MNALHHPDVAASEHSLAVVATKYLAAYTGRDSSRHQRISAWIRMAGHLILADITPEDIDEVMARLAAEPARTYSGLDADGNAIYRAKKAKRSGATLNRYQVALAALFAWARRNRHLPRTFVSPTKFVEKNAETRGRVRFLSNDERDRLLDACQGSAWPRLTLLVLMALTTGARRGELLQLRWCDIDHERGEARIGEDPQRQTKNGDARTLILLPLVLEELARFAPKDASTSTALVFRSRLRPSRPYATAKVFNEAVAEAGIKNFRFHDCRHCTASYMAQSGASLLEIADTLGHRQLRMVQRYAHLNTDSRRTLMARTFKDRL